MGFWDWVNEKPQAETSGNENRSIGSGLDFLGNQNAEEGLSETRVLSIPIAKSCHDKICSSIASLPVFLYREDENGNIERIVDDKRLELLNKQPNLTMTSYDFKESVAHDLLMHGTSYIAIEKTGNAINELWNINPLAVTPQTYTKSGYRIENVKFTLYSFDENSEELMTFDLDDLVILVRNSKDGIRGKGVLDLGRETFKLALYENELSSAIFKKGTLASGILSIPTKLSSDALARLRESWRRMYSGADNFGSTVILENGAQYQRLSLTPSELGLNASRSETNSQICKLFGVPEALVDSKSNTYGSVEAMSITFLQYTVEPLLTIFEEALNRSLLLESEKADGYYFEFDTKSLLRTTIQEQINALKTGIESGLYTVNEARAMINLHALPHDMMKFSLGNVLYYLDEDKFIVPNTSQNIEAEVGIDE